MKSSKTIRESPVGGSRIAWSYLVGVAAAALGGLIVAMTAPAVNAACADSEALCNLGWTAIIFGGSLLVGLGVGAFLAGLGWEWWAVVAAGVLALPLISIPGFAVAGIALALLPLVAALVTWQGEYGPAWRPWVVAVASVAAGGAGIASVLM